MHFRIIQWKLNIRKENRLKRKTFFNRQKARRVLFAQDLYAAEAADGVIMESKKWKQSVIYQIYPRSFMDGNGDGVGDLTGIASKLDYLKDLGIDIIWLSPIYKSPNEDNGYDISDYQDTMEEFGTLEDFDYLLSEAHARGIKIIMDLVVNHTSDEHPWFVESRKSKTNHYRDYYIWKEGKNGQPPNNWGSYFSGSAWQYDETTDMYYLHLFSKKQPDLNWELPKVRDEVYKMMTWWCDKGIDGFRMDVISLISKDQSYADLPVQEGNLYGNVDRYLANGPRVHEFLKEINRKVLFKYDLVTVGETTGVTIEEAKKYAGFNTNELNMVFQFEHVNLDNGIYGKWTDKRVSLVELKKVMNKWQTELEGAAWNSLYWNNHDQPRAVSRFGNDSEQYRVISAKMLATCLHMMKGTPYIYQGEELGMTNNNFDKLEDFNDVEIKNAYRELVEENHLIAPDDMIRCINKRGRDNARTPMHWSNTENAGFTTGAPWIKINPNYKDINAGSQIHDENSVFSYYKKLVHMRKQEPLMVEGTFHLRLPDREDIFAYERIIKNEKLLVVCNFTEKEAAFEVPEDYLKQNCKKLIGNYSGEGLQKIMKLKPYETFVYKQSLII